MYGKSYKEKTWSLVVFIVKMKNLLNNNIWWLKKCEAIKCFQFQGLVIANSHGKLIGNKDSKESFNDETDCQTELEN